MSDISLQDSAIQESLAGEEIPKPEVSSSVKPKRRAILNSGQALAVAQSLIDDADVRIAKAAKIDAKANGTSMPFNYAELQEKALTHKSNINTGFLATIISKVYPKLVTRIKSATYLTSASLPPSFPNATEKTEIFRRVITETIRSWPKWHTFVSGLAVETSKHGYCFPSFLDDIEWRPRMFRMDQCFIPNGTDQREDRIPFVVYKDKYMIHEMFDFVQDREAASAAGWNVANVVESINKAMPKDEDNDSDEENARIYEDLEREAISSTSFSEGARHIEIRHVFATEADGMVTQYMIDANSKAELFKKEDRYQSMGNVIVPFPFEYGNGTVHGSRGVGEIVYDMSVSLEQTRNETMDNLRRAGKFKIRVADDKELTKARLHTTDEATFLTIGTFAGAEAAVPFSAEPFLALDREFRAWAEEAVGVFLPEPLIPGAVQTATQANINALKEGESKEAIMDNWLTNFAMLMKVIQRRILNPETIDPIALSAQEQLLQSGLTPEEIFFMAETSPIQTTVDFSEQKRNEKLAFLQSNIGNPMYNQHVLETKRSTLVVGSQETEDILIAQDDNSLQIEAQRQQTNENDQMTRGIDVSVSPRDNHVASMQVIEGQFNPEIDSFDNIITQVLSGGDTQTARRILGHYEQHMQMSIDSGELGEAANEKKAFLGEMDGLIQEIENSIAQQQEGLANQGAGAQQITEADLAAIAEVQGANI